MADDDGVAAMVADMEPRERATFLLSFMQSAMQITAACPPELVAAVQNDARRWDTLGPFLDPTTFARVTGSKAERIGTKALAAFTAFHREVIALGLDLEGGQ